MKGIGEDELARILAGFPKRRPPLPTRMQAIYTKQYLENRAGASTAASLAQRLEAWMHRQVAADVRPGRQAATLELGAGSLNQLAYEPAVGPYDIVEPFQALLAAAPDRGRIRDVFADIAETPLDRRYDRITSIATLEHVLNLPAVLAHSARLMAAGGVFRAAIPSEGGLLWKLGWMATTGLEFRLRHGLDYGDLMRHEHVNNAYEIESLCRAMFEEVSIRSFGFSRQLSLYRFIVAGRPRDSVAAAWLSRFG